MPDSRPADSRPAESGTFDAFSSPDAPRDAPDGFVLPPMDLGTMTVPGTCTDAYRGWSFDDGSGCSADDHTRSGPSSRQISIVSDGMGGYQITTTLGAPYTVTVSQAQPTAHQVTSSTCDPIYGTCVEHDWTLAAHSLVLVSHSLHDNSSSTPPPQCWEYYYEKIDCTFELDW
jgi:hypothetical protein